MNRKIVFLLCLYVSFAWSVYAVDFTMEDFTMLFVNNHSVEVNDRAGKSAMMRSYCSQILSPTSQSGGFVFSGPDIAFRSDQSLFTAILCSTWDATYVPNESLTEVMRPDLYIRLSLEQLKQAETTEDVCALKKNECDLNRYSSRIFTALMSDIFKIKWANFVGIRSDQLGSKKERIDALFSLYFSMESDSLPSFTSTYPKTTKMIDNNQQHFVKSLQTLKVLDLDVLSPLTCEETPSLLVCGLYAGKDGMNQQFLNFLYNEYVNYAIFVDVATNYFRKKARLEMNPAESTWAYDAVVLSQQRALYQQAIQYTLDDLKDFIATYPLHIGLVLYQERLIQFRDSASKILPPFYSLYEKLRNVQIP